MIKIGLLRNRKAVIFHVGFGVLLLVLVVVYVLIKLKNQQLGDGIDQALTNLSNSVSGLIPFTGK